MAGTVPGAIAALQPELPQASSASVRRRPASTYAGNGRLYLNSPWGDRIHVLEYVGELRGVTHQAGSGLASD